MNPVTAESFRDELKKLAASKTRSGSKPIRVETLTNKKRIDKSSSTLKTAGVLELLEQHPELAKSLYNSAGVGAGALGGMLSAGEGNRLVGGLTGGTAAALGGLGPLTGAGAGAATGLGVRALERAGDPPEKLGALAPPKVAPSFLGRHAGKIGLGLGSVFAWEQGKQMLRDFQLGRAIRRQQEQSQSGR